MTPFLKSLLVSGLSSFGRLEAGGGDSDVERGRRGILVRNECTGESFLVVRDIIRPLSTDQAQGERSHVTWIDMNYHSWIFCFQASNQDNAHKHSDPTVFQRAADNISSERPASPTHQSFIWITCIAESAEV